MDIRWIGIPIVVALGISFLILGHFITGLGFLVVAGLWGWRGLKLADGNGLKRRLIVPTAVLIIVIGIFTSVVGGYRLSALSAARSNPFVTKSYRLFATYKIGQFGVFLFKSDKDKMYRTVVSEKSGVLYRSDVSTYIPYGSGAIQTVGSMNYLSRSSGFTFLSVKSNTSAVAYIEAGARPNLEKKGIKKGQTISFLFINPVAHLQAKAFDSKGKELYYYGYPKNTNVYTSSNFGWHRSQN